jgi:hypothetical protein
VSALPLKPPVTGAAERRAGRDRLHTGLLVLGWALMIVLWWRVLLRTDTGLLVLAAVFVLASLLLNVTATTLWVEHNVRIFIEKGPRTGTTTTAILYEQDWVGRSVSADWAAMGSAREVVVSVEGGTKSFVSRDSAHPDPHAARAAA